MTAGTGPQCRVREGRLLLNHGPIDLVILAEGRPAAVAAAYRAATARFATILDELCAELAVLRRPADQPPPIMLSPVGRRMHEGVIPYAPRGFITPMAAVAGAVADEILASMTTAADLDRAYVNNGGDIALHLARGKAFALGVVARPDRPHIVANARIRADRNIRGIATSGWRGRSFSLGIADAVTVLAATAADADAAATIIANAVDLPGHPGIARMPAEEIQPDNDLGHRLVTVGVAPLSPGEIACALDRGLDVADRLVAAGRIAAASLFLDGHSRIAGAMVFDHAFPAPAPTFRPRVLEPTGICHA